jgi:hypothetical protein
LTTAARRETRDDDAKKLPQRLAEIYRKLTA